MCIITCKINKIGLAEIQEKNCLAYNGSTCMVCYDACPVKRSAIIMKMNKLVIVEEECTGCGICEEACIIEKPKGVIVTSLN